MTRTFRSSRARARPAGRRKRPGSPRARLFIALDLPPSGRRELAAWRDRAIEGRQDLRPVAPDALHLTLVFLGYRPEREIPRIASTAFAAVGGLPAPRLVPDEIKSVPPRRPRLFALGLEDLDGGAAAVQAAVSDALEATGLHRPEKRPFWPHVTLARVKANQRAKPLVTPAPPAAELQAAELTLYRSTLRREGALYEPLRRHALG